MTNPNPNTLYKQSFRALAEKLGRVPNTRDKEWWEMHEDYKKGWKEQCLTMTTGATTVGSTATVKDHASPTLTTGATPAEPSSNAMSAEVTGPMTTDAEPTPADGTLSRPGTLGNWLPDRTTGTAENGAGSIDRRAMGAPGQETVGGRGPNGGVLATCVACGRVWERERRRGRPSLVCGECR